jgi:hypothetical protein
VTYAGGGGGGRSPGSRTLVELVELVVVELVGGPGGSYPGNNGTAGTVNTGGGAGGSYGKVHLQEQVDQVLWLLEDQVQLHWHPSPCTNTTSTAPGGCKVATFTVSGTLTVS